MTALRTHAATLPGTRSLAPHRGEWLALAAALVAFALAAWLGHDAPGLVLQGYLVGWLFCLGLPLGCMTLSSIHVLTGGRWGRALAPDLHAGAGVLPLLGLLWLPLLLGMSMLLPWTSAVHEHGRRLPHWYLNAPFQWTRSLLCLALWLGMAWRQRRWHRGVPPQRQPLAEQAVAGVSLLLLLLTISITGVDWIMALVPRWHSTALGMLLMTSFITIALALAVALWTRRAPRPASPDADTLQLRRDGGNLLLAAVLGWAYLAFMDYLTAWIGDLPSETVWYLPRLQWPWSPLPIALLVLHLGVPMALLLPRWGKQNLRVLAAVAALVALMQFVNLMWLVLPGVRPAGSPWVASDALVWLGFALCLVTAWRVLRRGQEHATHHQGQAEREQA